MEKAAQTPDKEWSSILGGGWWLTISDLVASFEHFSEFFNYMKGKEFFDYLSDCHF
jgi:hypothetical protein